MVFLSVSKLKKSYSRIRVLNELSFTIKKGEFVSIFGPNGCGKSTLLNILAGLDRNFSGKIKYFQKNIKKGFIFQHVNDSVLPWKTITENILLDKKIPRKRIKEVLIELKLWRYRNKYPYQLSGGMKQLLAIARAFSHGCNLLFLDEPFSSLDYHIAIMVREKLLRLWQKEKPTVLFVSHDIDEAILLSDRIIVLSKDPARIKEIIKVNIQRPRKRNQLTSNKFNNYRKKILELIKDEV
jgi:NitT/TauT family transport system ATP-binding protein